MRSVFSKSSRIWTSDMARRTKPDPDTIRSRLSPRGAVVRTEGSFSFKTQYGRVRNRGQQIRVLQLLTRLRTYYQEAGCLDGKVCQVVSCLLQELAQAESRYGPDIKLFFEVLQRMMVADENLLQDLGEEEGSGLENVPQYYCLLGEQIRRFSSEAKEALGKAKAQIQRMRAEKNEEVCQVRSQLTTLEEECSQRLKSLREGYQFRVTALCRKVGSLKGERDALETALAEQKRSMKELEAERRVEVNRIVESFRHLGIHENPFEGLVGSGIEGCFE